MWQLEWNILVDPRAKNTYLGVVLVLLRARHWLKEFSFSVFFFFFDCQKVERVLEVSSWVVEVLHPRLMRTSYPCNGSQKRG